MAEQSLAAHLEDFLARQGGTVVQRLVLILRKSFAEDAPELADEEALKAFVASQPETFKIITSCNDVERVKLVNPPKRDRRKRNPLLEDVTVKALEEQVGLKRAGRDGVGTGGQRKACVRVRLVAATQVAAWARS